MYDPIFEASFNEVVDINVNDVYDRILSVAVDTTESTLTMCVDQDDCPDVLDFVNTLNSSGLKSFKFEPNELIPTIVSCSDGYVLKHNFDYDVPSQLWVHSFIIGFQNIKMIPRNFDSNVVKLKQPKQKMKKNLKLVVNNV